MTKSLSILLYLLILVSLICAIIFFRLFIANIYQVPSQSMQPSLSPGDYILVSKISYSPRVVKVWKLLAEKRLEYSWYCGLGSVKRGDVVVFNYPDYNSLYDRYPDIYGYTLVKRCCGLPGDTLKIINKELIIKNNLGQKKNFCLDSINATMSLIKRIDGSSWQPDLFPHDSSIHWSLDNFGPILVPQKGQSIQLTSMSAKFYKNILRYEGYKTELRGDSVYLNFVYTPTYTFKENYYFMLGDNFYLSQDSRYWGFVPEKNIIGKVILVLFSLDPDEPWCRKLKWNRLLKKIK